MAMKRVLISEALAVRVQATSIKGVLTTTCMAD
jgi:hypothetical protein